MDRVIEWQDLLDTVVKAVMITHNPGTVRFELVPAPDFGDLELHELEDLAADRYVVFQAGDPNTCAHLCRDEEGEEYLRDDASADFLINTVISRVSVRYSGNQDSHRPLVALEFIRFGTFPEATRVGPLFIVHELNWPIYIHP